LAVKGGILHLTQSKKGENMETKICNKCGTERDFSCYPVRVETGKQRATCNLCWNQYQRERYLEKQGKLKRTVRAENRESDPKRCIRCGEEKALSEFTFHNRNKGQHRNFCHECEKEWIRQYHKSSQGKEKRKEWVQGNREKIEEYRLLYKQDEIKQEKSKIYHRARWLKENFNMTVDDYMAMYEKQNGQCAICGSDSASNGRRKNFCVDHSHSTGKVRGLLCHSCNVSIGLMKDSPSLLRQAADYLDTF
jgi:hypothetical protein